MSEEQPRIRTFTLNSREFHEAVTEPPDPWVWAGGLPKDPPSRKRRPIIEPRKRQSPSRKREG